MKKYLSLLLAVMMVLSTVSFAAPQMADTAIDTSEVYEVPATDAASDEEAALEAETYGDLVINVDFENAEIGTKVPTNTTLSVDSVGTSNLPEGFPNAYFRVTQNTMTVAEDENGNKYGNWQIGNAGWGKFGIYAGEAEQVMFPEGVYTLVADVQFTDCKKTTTAEDGTVTTVDVAYPYFSYVFTPNNPDGSFTTGEVNNNGKATVGATNEYGYTEISMTRNYYEGQYITAVISNKASAPYEFKGLGKLAFYYDLGGSLFTQANIRVDNIKLYYKAPDVKITLDDGVSSTTNKEYNLVAGMQTLDLTKDVLASDSDKAFTGWAIKGTNEAITTYTPSEAGEVTLVPVYNYYAPGLGFEGDEYATKEDFKAAIFSTLQYEGRSTDDMLAVNPTTFDVDTEEGIFKIYGEYTEAALADSSKRNIKLNFHMNNQISSKKPLNTNAIKGVEYKFRYVPTDDTVVDPTFFTNNSGITSKVYYKVNWPEGAEETACYTGEGINGWHWGECISATTYHMAKGTEYNGEWITNYVDLNNVKSTSHGYSSGISFWEVADSCVDFRIQFMSNVVPTGNFTIEVDYVRFVLSDDVAYFAPEVLSYDFYDQRKGCMDVTVAEKLEGVDASELSALVDGPFTVAELIENEDSTATYRLYAESSLKDKTATFKKYAYTSNSVIVLPDDVAGVSHTYTNAEVAEKADGENLVPNGDFSNPYYIPYNRGNYNLSIVDGVLNVELKETAAEWNSLTTDTIKFKPNTRYYYSVDIDFVKDSVNNPHAEGTTASEVLSIYFPVADGEFSSSRSNPNTGSRISELSYIPSTTKHGAFGFNYGTLGKDANAMAKVIEIMTPEYYDNEENIKLQHSNGKSFSDSWNVNNKFYEAPAITFQTCISEGIKAGFYTRNAEKTSVIEGAGGLTYQLKSFIVKEMFPVTLLDGENVLDTLYAAKDIEIVLPSATAYATADGSSIVGWKIGETTYAPGAKFVLTSAEAVSATAVTEVAPITDKSISIRTDAFTGVRFKASVSNVIKADEKTTEYGYIVTRKTILDAAGVAQADFTKDSDVVYVSGKNYSNEENLDKVFEDDGKYNYFTAVVYNIPEEQYDDVLVARPYMVYDGVTTYGAPVAASLREAAVAIKGSSAYNDLNDDAKAVVDGIVG